MQGPVKVLQVMTLSLRFASPLLDNTFEKYGSCKTHKGGGGMKCALAVCYINISMYLLWMYFDKDLWSALTSLASHAGVLRGSSRVPAPRTSADLSGKKRRPITADFQIWEVHFGPWQI